MKLIFLSVVVSILFLEACEAQFGFGGFGGATQNCAGSQCNQNNFGKREAEAQLTLTQQCVGSFCNQNNFSNFGRKKREIANAINALAEEALEAEAKEIKKREAQVQNCQGSACNQNNLGGGFGGFSGFAGATGGFGGGFGGGGATQNCVGSQCNQNNLGKKKREILSALNALAEEALEAEDLHSRVKRQVQNCQGSACNQNNLGGGFGGFGGFPGGAAGGFGGASQNCVGSQCNQNNFGRRKRAVLAALLEEARMVSEAELEAEAPEETVEAEAPEETVEAEAPEVTVEAEAPEETVEAEDPEDTAEAEASPVHVLECSGTTSSSCENKLCTVQCSDGSKVELECASNSVAIQSTSVDTISVNEVACGSKRTKPMFRSCFPFC